MAVLGNNIIVTMGGTAIAGTKTDHIQCGADLIEISSPSSGDWKQYVSGRKEWSVTTGFLLLANTDVSKLLTVGTRVQLVIKERNSTGVTGYAYIKTCEINANRENIANGTFTFVGDGALT